MSDESPVEIVRTTESESEVTSGSSHLEIHAWVRTMALVVGAAALVWAVNVVAGIREAERGQTCLAELQAITLSPRPGLTREQIGEQLIGRATDCGLDLTADSIRQNYEDS